jgi:hypothetical protein
MSNTSMTSTMGVTLMLALTLVPSFLTAIAMGFRSDRILRAGAAIRRRESGEATPGSKILAHLHRAPSHRMAAVGQLLDYLRLLLCLMK